MLGIVIDRMASKRKQGGEMAEGDDYTGGWKRGPPCTPELRVSHIFADLPPTTKSFSPVPLFSARKSCSVTVLMRNTRLKRFSTHLDPADQSISPSLTSRRWITNFCIGEGREAAGSLSFFPLSPLFRFVSKTNGIADIFVIFHF